MTATADQIAQLRRMTAEPTQSPYEDDALTALIESFPMMDERGVVPYYYNTVTNPPTQVATAGWYPTYDLNAAAAQVWEEKAADVAQDFDYPNTQGGQYAQSTLYKNYKAQARFYSARRAVKTATGIPWPSRNRHGDSIVGNLPEGYYWDE